MRDLSHNSTPLQVLPPAARTATANGTTIDLSGYSKAMIVIGFGTWTDGTHTPSLQESPDGSTWTNVAASDMTGAFTAISSSGGSNTVQKAGYVGYQRYIRPVLTVANATTGAISTVMALLENPRLAPV